MNSNYEDELFKLGSLMGDMVIPSIWASSSWASWIPGFLNLGFLDPGHP